MGTVKPSSAVATISRVELEATITALHGRLEPHPAHPNRYCVPRSAAPSILERRQLSAAHVRLEAQLEPCEDELVIEAVVSQFLTGFEVGKGGSDLNTAALNGRYVKALVGLPLAAIHAAIDRFDAALTLIPRKPAFRPNPGELAAEVREGMVGIRSRLIHVRRALDAEIYDPPTAEDEAKVAEAMRKFLEARRAFGDDRPVLPTREQSAAALNQQIDALRGLDQDPSLAHLMANLDDRRARR